SVDMRIRKRYVADSWAGSCLSVTPVDHRRSHRIVTVLSRAELLRRGIGGGAMLAASGAGFAAFARPAGALTVPDGDVAYLRVLVAAELLKAEFHTQAPASGKLAASAP